MQIATRGSGFEVWACDDKTSTHSPASFDLESLKIESSILRLAQSGVWSVIRTFPTDTVAVFHARRQRCKRIRHSSARSCWHDDQQGDLEESHGVLKKK